MPKLRVIKFPVGSDPFAIDIDHSLEGLQAEVGGTVQTLGMPEQFVLCCNENGKLLKLPPNRMMQMHGVMDVIRGDFFITHLGGEGEFTSLTPAQINHILNDIAET